MSVKCPTGKNCRGKPRYLQRFWIFAVTHDFVCPQHAEFARFTRTGTPKCGNFHFRSQSEKFSPKESESSLMSLSGGMSRPSAIFHIVERFTSFMRPFSTDAKSLCERSILRKFYTSFSFGIIDVFLRYFRVFSPNDSKHLCQDFSYEHFSAKSRLIDEHIRLLLKQSCPEINY